MVNERNVGLELHDSELHSVTQVGRQLHIALRPAYIYRANERSVDGKNILDTPSPLVHHGLAMKNKDFPKSFLQAARYFADLDVCVDFVASMRWLDGVVCPHCGSRKVSYLSTRRIWKCMNRDCHKQFSVKTGSVFEDSPLPLDKWLTAVWLIVNCKNGISSYEISRDLAVTQKSAWFMLHRIRLALRKGNWNKIGGEDGGPVEVDETFIGPKPQAMHRARRLKMQTALKGSNNGKTIVMGMLDRESRQVRAQVVPNVKRETLQNAILAEIEKGSTVYTDGYAAYDNLAAREYIHETVNHVDEYVRGNASALWRTEPCLLGKTNPPSRHQDSHVAVGPGVGMMDHHAIAPEASLLHLSSLVSSRQPSGQPAAHLWPPGMP